MEGGVTMRAHSTVSQNNQVSRSLRVLRTAVAGISNMTNIIQF